MAETKTAIIEGVKVLMQKCWNHADPACLGWFVKNYKNKVSCSDRCAMKKCKSWQNRNNKAKKK
jgi:hypothetical protein